MNNKVTFTGAFLIKNPPYQAKKELENLAGRHKQIFENFDNSTDVFYVVRRGKDKGIAKFIKENNLRFKFFPKISTKSGLDPLYPKDAVETADKQSFVISNIDILSKMFKLDPPLPKLDFNVEGIAHSLGLKEQDLITSSKNGVAYAFTKNNEYVFKASPTNKYGENYVYLNKGNHSEKYLIRGDKIIFKYPSDAKYFDKNFENCVAHALYCEV